ncbi:hypothetical protein PR048_014325 [Dryococelus australis]|uniref:U1-type domain-containing protein n=1 Tax=Dryococelus australis TaxID=614101 RepID=A0ABQ9HE26_9NEOP|nr:hypothetical protein PR048_014325 [Dryococelus australis]
MSKRKCKSSDTLKTKFPVFVQGRTGHEAKCVTCDCCVSVVNSSDLEHHVSSEKHWKIVRSSSPTAATQKREKIFNVLESKQKQLFEMSLLLMQPTLLLRPWKVFHVLALLQMPVIMDQWKYFTVLIQYFDWKKSGTKTKDIGIQALENEQSETIANNANVNFGGLNRKVGRNAYSFLKNRLGRNIVGVGCPAHIFHNNLQDGTYLLKFDIESLVMKVFNYFSLYTVRTESLKELCNSVDSTAATKLNQENFLKTNFLNFTCGFCTLLCLPLIRKYKPLKGKETLFWR